MSSSRPAEIITDMLSRLFGRYSEAAKKHGVYTLETIGDAYIVTCGLNKEKDHGVRMIKFGLEMVEIANSTPIEVGKPDTINIRVGIHTGPVVGTLMGKFTLLGDTMNVSSRMESSSIPNHVQASYTLYKKTKTESEFHFIPRGSIPIKGKGQLKTFFVSRGHTAVPVQISSEELTTLPGTV